MLEEPVVERKEVLVIFHFLHLARNHSGIGPTLVVVFFDLDPCMTPVLSDQGSFSTVSLYWQNLPEPGAGGVQDTSGGWFLRFIKPSPCMFVRA